LDLLAFLGVLRAPTDGRESCLATSPGSRKVISIVKASPERRQFRRWCTPRPCIPPAASCHTNQHWDGDIGVVINLDFCLVLVEAMKAAHVLLQRAFPGNRRHKEQRIQPSVVGLRRTADGKPPPPTYGVSFSAYSVAHCNHRASSKVSSSSRLGSLF